MFGRRLINTGGAAGATPFDLGNYTLNASEFYDYSAISIYAVGLFFSPDGTKAFWTEPNNNEIQQVSLSTAWDISTATVGTAKTGLTANARGTWMNNDGTKFYHTKPLSGQVYEYTLSTAYDTSTASNTYIYSHGNSTRDSGICFNYDGTKMYIATDDAGVYQYSLSTAWSTSTASYDSKKLSIPLIGSEQSWDVYINYDGTKFFNVIQADNQRIDEYELSVPYDVSTGSKVRSFDYTPYGENSLGLHFKPDGSKLFIAMYGTNDIIKTFDLS